MAKLRKGFGIIRASLKDESNKRSLQQLVPVVDGREGALAFDCFTFIKELH
jgi:hypothetical protein